MNINEVRLNTEDDELSKDDMWKIINDNRGRAKTFGNLIVSLSSILLGLFNGYIYFSYSTVSENDFEIWSTIPFVVLINFLFIYSMVESTRSFYFIKPVAIHLKSELILYLSNQYYKEVLRLRRAFHALVSGLIVSILFLIFSLFQ